MINQQWAPKVVTQVSSGENLWLFCQSIMCHGFARWCSKWKRRRISIWNRYLRRDLRLRRISEAFFQASETRKRGTVEFETCIYTYSLLHNRDVERVKSSRQFSILGFDRAVNLCGSRTRLGSFVFLWSGVLNLPKRNEEEILYNSVYLYRNAHYVRKKNCQFCVHLRNRKKEKPA